MPSTKWPFFGITVNFSLEILKSKNLVGLSLSCNSRAKIYLSMEKIWAYENSSLNKNAADFCSWFHTIFVQIFAFWECLDLRGCLQRLPWCPLRSWHSQKGLIFAKIAQNHNQILTTFLFKFELIFVFWKCPDLLGYSQRLPCCNRNSKLLILWGIAVYIIIYWII